MKSCTLIALFGVIVWQHHSALAQPSAAQLLSEIGLSADDQQRVLNGEFVTKEDAESSDKDLALSIAFLVKTTPANLSEQILAGRLIGTDPQVVASGEFSGAGSLTDLAALQVGDETLRGFLNARPGEALNLSAREISAFDALHGAGPKAALRDCGKLLDRFQATSDRVGRIAHTPAAAARRTSQKSCAKPRMLRRCAQVHARSPTDVLDYPRVTVTGLREAFRWMHYNIDGTTTLALMHELTASYGAGPRSGATPVLCSTG